MFSLSFRLKILLAMMFVVLAVTGATLYTSQRVFQKAQRRELLDRFQEGTQWYQRLRELRLKKGITDSRNFCRNVRNQSPLRQLNLQVEAGDEEKVKEYGERLYKTAEDELRYELDDPVINQADDRVAFFRFLDENQNVLPVPKGVDAGRFRDEDAENVPRILSEVAVLQLENAQSDEDLTVVGFLTLLTGRAGSSRVLLNVLVSAIIDPVTGEYIGALALAYPEARYKFEDGQGSEPGVLLENGELYLNAPFEGRTDELVSAILEKAKNVDSQTEQTPLSGSFESRDEGDPYHAFYSTLGNDQGFPTAYIVTLFPLGKALAEQKNLLRTIVWNGSLGALAALAFSLTLSLGLVVAIRKLVRGTEAVQSGDLSVSIPVGSQDEIGHLTQSFNGMVEGLALKEKYRSILSKTSGESIAEKLAEGQIELGGEVRDISVLFCDIRGFTALTQKMDPKEVIRMLNEHFTPLARVVEEHHGVVDKFVGDLIMAIFGAPESDGMDSVNAVRCAEEMIAIRDAMNTKAERKIFMGIGVASGEAVAGNMGSEDRLNYTVLGDRVNLAARLCGQAASMDVVVDDNTYHRSFETSKFEELPPLTLKGFDKPLPAFRLAREKGNAENENE